MSQILFQKSLPHETARKLFTQQQNFRKSSAWSWWGRGAQKQLANKPSTNSKLSLVPRSTTPILDSTKSYAKSLRLTSEQLKSLDLKDGMNTVEFSVSSGFQGKAVCTAKIFVWNCDAKIVISDVDGTITKSDVLGHVFTMVGKDWTHEGVANYYTSIKNNGYQFLYLTSRAIGQAGYTRQYLAGVEQDQMVLPDGPVLLSPARLVEAFKREVVERRPEIFKIACLKDIKKLFGEGKSPFYAGFGNRITDAMSYNSVSIPSSRIFTIDPSGEIKLELLVGYKTSYKKLTETVDQVFPPLKEKKDVNPEYSDFSYWKSEYPKVDVSSLAISVKEEDADELASVESIRGSRVAQFEDSESEEETDDEKDEVDLQAQLQNMKKVSY